MKPESSIQAVHLEAWNIGNGVEGARCSIQDDSQVPGPCGPLRIQGFGPGGGDEEQDGEPPKERGEQGAGHGADSGNRTTWAGIQPAPENRGWRQENVGRASGRGKDR